MNTPTVGFSMLFHTLIISFSFIKKRDIFSFIKTGAFVGAIIICGSIAYQYSIGAHVSKALIDISLGIKSCQVNQSQDQPNKVIIRLDDVAPKYHKAEAKLIISEVLSYGGKVVLGIIPKDDFLTDLDYYYFLSSRACSLEFALHGWEHKADPAEFELLSEEDAYRLLSLGLAALKKTFPNETIDIFIPPENLYSLGTYRASKRLNFKYVSSEGDRYFDYTASTYDFIENEAIPNSKIIQNCQIAFGTGDPCIIMVHPQDFSTNNELDWEKYNHFRELLAELTKMQVDFIGFHDLK